MNRNTTLISDNEGESIGSVGNYINRFKDIDTGKRNSSDISYMYSSGEDKAEVLSIPEKWSDNTRSQIIAHYYRKLGDSSFTDYKKISPKVATTINRVYGLKLSVEETLSLLTDLIDQKAFIKEKILTKKKELKGTAKSVKVNLPTSKFDYIPNLDPIGDDDLELVSFVDSKLLCFSSKGDNHFYLSIKSDLKRGKKTPFKNLFNFSPKEKLMLEMYTDTLGDEAKAKKLILIARGLLDNPFKPKPTKKTKKVSKKKTTKDAEPKVL